MIPDKVNVSGVNYNVEFVDRFVENHNLQGQVIYHKGLIQIDKNMSDDKKEQTFVHEMLHACFNEAGYIEQDEDIINRVSIVLYQVLKDNKIDFSKP